MTKRSWLALPSLALSIGIGLDIARGQPRIPEAELTAVVETAPVRAGAEAVLRLEVELDEVYHVQSDRPRDELLIPTVLSVEPPEGVALEAIAYPPAEDFAQAGADEPLAVFPHAFSIEVRVALEPSVVPGQIDVPGRLQYQACDETVCYAPTSVETSWALTVSEP